MSEAETNTNRSHLLGPMGNQLTTSGVNVVVSPSCRDSIAFTVNCETTMKGARTRTSGRRVSQWRAWSSGCCHCLNLLPLMAWRVPLEPKTSIYISRHENDRSTKPPQTPWIWPALREIFYLTFAFVFTFTFALTLTFNVTFAFTFVMQYYQIKHH